MPIANYGILDVNAPNRLASLFNPENISQRQAEAEGQRTAQGLRQLQLAQAQQQMQRAPIVQQREDLAYQQQQEQLRQAQLAEQAKSIEAQQLQKLISQLPPQEQLAARLAPKEYFASKLVKPKPEDILGEKKYRLAEKELAWKMGQKPATPLEPAPKAAPGSRVYQEGGEWKSEVIKGSPQWQMYKSKEAPDRALVQNIVPQFEKNVSDIDRLVSSKGFDRIFGLIAGQTPNITSEAREAANLRAQVVGAMETAGMQLQRSSGGAVGSMTVQEWPKMQTYLNVIQNSNDPKAVKEALRGAQAVYERMADVAKEGYMNEWGSGQFGDPNVVARLSKEKPKQSATQTATTGVTNPQFPGFSIVR